MYLFLKMEDAVTSLAICANMNFVGFVNRNINCIRIYIILEILAVCILFLLKLFFAIIFS